MHFNTLKNLIFLFSILKSTKSTIKMPTKVERVKVTGHFRHYDNGKLAYIRPQVRNKPQK